MDEHRLTCPRCERSMQPTDHEDLDFDQCECGDLWFDHGELSNYLSRWACAEIAGGAQCEGEVLACPRCRTETLTPYCAAGQSFHQCQSCFGILVRRPVLDRLLACPETSVWGKVVEATRNLFERFR